MAREELFPIMHTIGKYAFVYYIVWNPISRRYETNYGWKVKCCVLLTFLAGFIFILESMIKICMTNVWSKADIIFMVQMPLLFVVNRYISLYAYVKQEEIIKLYENLFNIDELLKKCDPELNFKQRRRYRSIKGISYVYILIVIQTIFAWIAYVYVPGLRELLLQGVIIHFGVYHVFCALLYKTLIIDRTDILCKLIKETPITGECFLCNKKVCAKKLCLPHMLRYSKLLLSSIFETTKLCYGLEKTPCNTGFFATIPQAPVYLTSFYGVLKFGFKGEYIKISIMILYAGFAAGMALVEAVLNRYLNNKLLKLARIVHKMYGLSYNKKKIETDVFCFSLEVLQELPELYILECTKFYPTEYMELFSGVVLFSVMVFQFNL